MTEAWLVAGGHPYPLFSIPLNQLFVFFVDVTGKVRGSWKEQDTDWKSSLILTIPGQVPVGASITTAYYEHGDQQQLEIFWVDNHGRVTLAWRGLSGNWNPPFPLTLDNFAVPGVPLAVVNYPLNNQLELFTTSSTGILNLLWKAQNGWWSPCPFPLETSSLTPAGSIQLVGTGRLGQLTGTQDPENKPLLNNTLAWGVPGADLGANTVHSDRKLYIFFGDVVRGDRIEGPRQDADLVAWTDATKLGGHEFAGFNFILPHDNTPAQGQNNWRYCIKCQALYFNGHDDTGICAGGGSHEFNPDSYNFELPYEPAAIKGQDNWRFCIKCQGLYFDGYDDKGVCPGGGKHQFHPQSYNFVLPHDETTVQGQSDWRFCSRCHSIFYNGYDDKGVCSAGGSAFRLNPVMGGAYFDPFTVSGAIGMPLTNETPTGAFSYKESVYVFIYINKRDDEHPGGAYIVSKTSPNQPGPFTEEFYFPTSNFWQNAPCVVGNDNHPGLPSSEGDGLIMFGHGYDSNLNADAIHLAWMPLLENSGPQYNGIKYYTADAANLWSDQPTKAAALFDQGLVIRLYQQPG
ncbi:MAG: hypothetical protein WKG06_22345 [Segetibacter sp.]